MSSFADEMFGCVWSFYGAGAWKVNTATFMQTQYQAAILSKNFQLQEWRR